ncbi:MAG: accessory factor UbiK family protein [Beijerinckiaceae bacterium]|nr:accessory factor UbiK family protein [Beijerinckiaceae bacterium]
MSQKSGRLFDDLSRLVSDASGVAQGVRREAETVLKGQAERLFAAMDVVTREEFEAVKQMAILARDENERLERRIKEIEAKLGLASTPPQAAGDASI